MIFSSRTMLQLIFVCVLILIGGLSCVKLNVTVPNGKVDGPQEKPKVRVPGIKKTTVTEIEVRVHRDIPLFPADVDKILKDANDVSNFSDGNGDEECSLVLTVKDGGIGKFNRPQIIRDEIDLNELNTTWDGLKVVKEIRWCNQFWPDILGCQKDNGIIVIRPHTSQEAILWLHELGHLNGLDHRNQPFAVMNEFILPMNKNLSRNECEKFQ